jgi:transcriptional regulator with XRE-family HTH domain
MPGVPTISPEEIKAWLSRQGHTATWLAGEIGVDKATVSRWLSGRQPVPGPESRLLRLLIRGELPFEIAALRSDGVLLFSAGEWRRIEALRARENFPSAEAWVVAKIRAYLAMLPSEG